METRLSEIPAFKALIVLLLSMTAFLFCRIPLYILLILSAFVLPLYFISRKYSLLKHYSYFLFLILSGFLLAHSINSVKINIPDKIIPEYPALISGTVDQILSSDSNKLRCTVIGDFDAQIFPKLANVRTMLNIKGDFNSLKNIQSGTHIMANVKARTPKAKSLDTDFPEDTYCASMDVQFIARSDVNKVAVVYLDDISLNLRDKIILEFENQFSKYFTGDTYAIVNALILGDKTAVKPEIKRLYSLTGTAHVLALSGLHISILAAALLALSGFVRNKYAKFALITLVVIFYTFVTGMQASAVRAAVGSILAIFAGVIHRKANLINILSIVVILSLVFNPSMILSAGFQMSVVSVYGILFFYANIEKSLKLVLIGDSLVVKYLRGALAVTFAASITVTPIVSYYFGSFSIVSPLTNIFIVPLMNGALVFGAITLVFAYVAPPLAVFYAGTTTFLIKASNYINTIALSIPNSYYSGRDAFVLSIVISLLLLYLLNSKSLKQYFFRGAYSFVFMSLCINLTDNKIERAIRIIPQDQFCAAIIPGKNNKSIIYICDRKPATRPFTNVAFENFLLQSADSLKMIITGNAGIKITDNLKKKIKFEYIEASIPLQRQIEKLIFENKRLCQIIETNINEIGYTKTERF